MKHPLRLSAIVLASAAAIALVVAAFAVAHRQSADNDEDEQPIASQVHVFKENGHVILKLTQQQRWGIAVAALQSVSAQSPVDLTALLLPVRQLAAGRSGYVAAQAKVQQAQLKLQLARTEYERVKRLYDEDQNMSLRAKQEAESSYTNEKVSSEAANQQLRLTLDALRQQWGGVMARWIADDDPQLSALLSQQAFIAQIAFNAGTALQPPRTITLWVPNGERVRGRYISPSPIVNAQVQGATYFYLVPARPGLAAGMILAVTLAAGESVKGSFVPASAIVWWQGKAWAYEDLGAGRFTRIPVPTDAPWGSGYLVGNSFPVATRLVVAGAQLLLSEEFRGQIQQEG